MNRKHEQTIYQLNVNVNLMGKKCSSNQGWNYCKCRLECRRQNVWEKDYVWNHATCNCKNGK